MAEFLRTPKSVILPTLENIEDEKLRKVLEEYNRAFNEIVTAIYSDLAWLHQRIYDLEHP